MPLSQRIKKEDVLVLIVGSVTLIAWVFFRFFTKSINFDLVGQQLLVRQWMGGNFEGSLVGPTNYILKMLFLYAPAEALGIDQKLFLVTSTILINILTFIGLYFILKKILDLFSINPGVYYRLAVLWMAAAAGSIFWVQFTNSRNIELLAGMTLLYLGLLFYKESSWRIGAGFLLLAVLTYFSDPMQFFTTSMALVAYVLLHSIFLEREKKRVAPLIAILVGAAYLFSKILTYLIQEATSVEIISVSTQLNIPEIIMNLPTVLIETAKNALRLLTGTNEMGVWRQGLNMFIVAVLGFLSLVAITKGKFYRNNPNFLLFVSLTLLVPLAVYILSGQPLNKIDTSRYLIALAPALLMLFAVADEKKLPKYIDKMSTILLLFLAVINIGSLMIATLQQRNTPLLASSHLEERFTILESNSYNYGYASMDTAIPAMYLFARESEKVLLPLSCEDGKLRKATLFYDRGVFIKQERENIKVPIILDGDSITNHPSVCSLQEIRRQLGPPVSVMKQGDNTVLLYSSNQMNRLGF